MSQPGGLLRRMRWIGLLVGCFVVAVGVWLATRSPTTGPGRLIQRLADCLSVSARPAQHSASSASLAANPEPFRPNCPTGDPACAAWTHFRLDHPYPYQAFAAHRLPGGKAVLLISEPPPTISLAGAVALVNAALADRNPTTTVNRWMIGSDGYVEDVVTTFDAPDLGGDDILSDPDLRDRMALLQQAWFGTACGGDVEVIGDSGLQRASATAPNLQVTAAELRGWMKDSSLLWTRIEDDRSVGYTWDELSGDPNTSQTGAFIAADQSLTLFTFNRSALDDPATLAALKVDFRRFAVSSDAIVGAVWTLSGHVGLVGRVRTHALSEIPPLRFEIFALIAGQHGNTLQQSYERTNPLAGKMHDGRDWAPIYLSPALIDSEFGALLNITDQMLKSWSEAGTINYLYFHYPLKPAIFPFSNSTLSDLVFEKTGSSEVLYNWNTTGAAVKVNIGDLTVMVSRQLGALPVTYGSELHAGGPVVTGHLIGFEDTAYDYFARLGDPNLARVVQYTLIYQALRNSESNRDPAPQLAQESPQMALLVARLRELLPDLAAGTLRTSVIRKVRVHLLQQLGPGIGPDPSKAAAAALRAFTKKHPDVYYDQLAYLLADQRDGLSTLAAMRNNIFAGIPDPWLYEQQLRRDKNAFNHRVDELNAQGDWTADQKSEMYTRRADLEARMAKLASVVQILNDLKPLSGSVQEAIEASEDLSEVRRAFEQAGSRPVTGWIRTPTNVVSWGASLRQLVFSTGGHDIVAKVLRVEPSTEVHGVHLTDDGRILYSPDQADAVSAHAGELARAVEHDGATQADIDKIIAEGILAIRPRPVALAEASDHPTRVARLGGRSFDSVGEVADALKTLLADNPCCRFLIEGQDGHLYLGDTNPSPPPTKMVVALGDTASLARYLKRNPGTPPRDLIVLGQPRGHVEAMLAAFDTLDPAADMSSIIGRLRGTFFGLKAPSDHLIGRDLQGRVGALSVAGDARPDAQRTASLKALRTLRARGGDVVELDQADVNRILLSLDWHPARDGQVAAVRVPLSSGWFGRSDGSLEVLAGFVGGDGPSNQHRLLTVVSEDITDGQRRRATLPQILMTISNDLRRQPGLQLKRLWMNIRQGSVDMQMTQRLRLPSDSALG